MAATKEFKKKEGKELQKMLAEKRAALRTFRFDSRGTKIKNVKEGANTKKEVARILTEMRSRELKG